MVEPLIQILNKYSNVKLVAIGWDYTNFSDFIPIADRIEYYGWDLDVHNFGKNLQVIDIGICPLNQEIEFNKGKSNNKFVEYSMLGIPTVATNIEPYSCIKNGETGILVDHNTTEEWVNALSELIENRNTGLILAEDANQYCKKNYNINQHIEKRHETYKALLNIK